MFREVSSRFLRKPSHRNASQEVENASQNMADPAMAANGVVSGRAPLCPISEHGQKPPAGVSTCPETSAVSRKFDTPSKPKGGASRMLAKSDLSEVTPEKQSSNTSTATGGYVLSRNRFGWAQKQEIQSRDATTATTSGKRSPFVKDNHSEYSSDVGFIPRSLNYANAADTHSVNGVMQQTLKTGNAGSSYATPRSIRTTGRTSSNASDNGSTTSTPSKSVSRPANNFRVPGFQVSSVRGGQSSKNLCVVNTVEVPHFELREDPSFWMDHNVQVLVRIRPLSSAEIASQGYNRCLKQESNNSLTWVGQPEARFTFDHVACETITQEMLFKVAGLPMVENCMSGYNSCMFAYGQTGSGKTHTMLGDIDNLDQKPSENRGMTPRIFEYLFARIKAEEESRHQEQMKYVCRCSFLEIYNEQITDLLEPSSTNLQLREDVQRGIYAENLTEMEVKSVHDVVQLLLLGAANRRVAATNMNRESSRSHSVFTCVIESHWEKDSMSNIRYGRLNLVDLAGSERQKTSGAEGERLKEAVNINKSLSTLGLVIMILVDVAHGKQRHIPYRDSRLTFLLQDSLGGNSKTTIIANVSPSICSASETLSTLKFAQRAKHIQNNAIVNEDASGDVLALQRQIQQLKEELSFLKHQNVSRSLSFRSTIYPDTKRITNGEQNGSCVRNSSELLDRSSELLHNSTASGSPGVFSKKLKSIEATLAGALRREQVADNAVKRLEAEIEQLNRLVRQREEDAQCSKMMLRFREDKIKRLESLSKGLLSAETCLMQERNALYEELQLTQGRLDRNPEVTRFAMENIRLLEQLRRFQEFYEGGEREILLSEISDLRDRLADALEEKIDHGNSPHVSSMEKADNGRKELEDCRAQLNTSLEANEKLTREMDSLQSQIEELKKTCRHQEEEIAILCKEVKSREKFETAELSSRKSIYTLQGKTQTDPELEMKHSEEVMHLQLELESVEAMLEEERSQRKEAEDRLMVLNKELEEANNEGSHLRKELEETLEKVEEEKSVIDALESQQLFSIKEAETLDEKNKDLIELLNRKENQLQALVIKNESLDRHLERKNDKLKTQKCQNEDICDQYANCEDSPVQVNLERMHDALKKAKKLNTKLQNEQASEGSNEEDIQRVQKQVEAEMAEVILTMQEELQMLREEIDSITGREADTNLEKMQLKEEIETLKQTLKMITEDNKLFKDEWEKASQDVSICLKEGDEALTVASEHMEIIIDSFPQRASTFCHGVDKVTEKERTIESLQSRLQHAKKSADDTEGKIKCLKEAAMEMTDLQKQEYEEMTREAFRMKSDLLHKASVIQELTTKIEWYKRSLRKANQKLLCLSIVFNNWEKAHDLKTQEQYRNSLEQNILWKNVISELKTEVTEAKLLIDYQKQEISKIKEERDELKSALSTKQNILDSIQEGARPQILNQNKEIMGIIKERDDLKSELLVLQNNLKLIQEETFLKEQDFHEIEHQAEVSWSKAFESNAVLCVNRDFLDNLKRNIQYAFEEANAFTMDLLCKIDHQTKEMVQTKEKFKEMQYKNNALLLAFVIVNNIAKMLQENTARSVSELKEKDSTLERTLERLEKAEFDLQTKDETICEMAKAMQALEVTKAEVESQKNHFMAVAEQSSVSCSNKENELACANQELADIHDKLEDAQKNTLYLRNRLDESSNQIMLLEEERLKLLADVESQKIKWNDEKEECESRKNKLEEQMQYKLRSTEKQLSESMMTITALIQEKSKWEAEKESLLRTEADATLNVSKKNQELTILVGQLAEVQGNLQEAEDKVSALSLLLEEFRCSEERWNSEREQLLSKIDILQAGLVSDEKVLEVQHLESIPTSSTKEDIQKLEIETEHLRESLCEKDQTILSVRKEMEDALESLDKAKAEMSTTLAEKEELMETNKRLIFEIAQLKEQVNEKETADELLQQEMTKMLEEMEKRMKDAEDVWRKEKEMLFLELNGSKLIAAEKTHETACLLKKFEESEETIREADIMLNTLLQAKETAKCDTEKWKNTEQELATERRTLIDEIERTKVCFAEKEHTFAVMQDENMAALNEAREMISAVAENAAVVMANTEDDFIALADSIRDLKSDVLQTSTLPHLWFEEILSTVLENDIFNYLKVEYQRERLQGTIELLHKDLEERSSRFYELEKHNMWLERQVKDLTMIVPELQEDLKRNQREEVFESIKNGQEISNSSERLKMDVSAIKQKNEMLRKQFVEKDNEATCLHKEIKEALIKVDVLEEENKNISLQLDRSFRKIEMQDDKIANIEEKEARLNGRIEQLLLELGQSREEFIDLQKAFDDLNGLASRKDQEIEALQIQLHESTNTLVLLEQSNKELLSQVISIENSLQNMESKYEIQSKDMERCQLTHARLLEEFSHKSKEHEELIVKFNSSEMEKLELRKNTSKDAEIKESLQAEIQEDKRRVEAIRMETLSHLGSLQQRETEIKVLTREKECLQTQLQQNNEKAKALRKENLAHQDSLQHREKEVMVLSQERETILKRMNEIEEQNRSLALNIRSQEKRNQELLRQIEFKDESLQNLEALVCQATHDSRRHMIAIENLETRLSGFLGRFLAAMHVQSTEEFYGASLEDIAQFVSATEEKIFSFFALIEDLEISYKELSSQNAMLSTELLRKDELVKGLQFDLSLLQESASKAKDQKDEVQEVTAALKMVQSNLLAKSNELQRVMSHNETLERELLVKERQMNSLNSEISELKNVIDSLSKGNSQLETEVKKQEAQRISSQEELEEKQKIIDSLEEELLEMNSVSDTLLLNSVENMKCDLDNVTRERDRLHADMLALQEQLEMAQAFAEEKEAVAAEARQVAEARKTYAEEKEEESKLLERSIEELEKTVGALETQVEIVRGEAERQRLMREDIEIELQGLKHQMLTMQKLQASADSQCSSASSHSIHQHDPRNAGEKNSELHEALTKLKSLEKVIEEKDVEIRKCKGHIKDLVANAEAQSKEHQHKYRALEVMAKQVKSEQQQQANTDALVSTSSISSSNAGKPSDKTAAKSRGSGSPFKCIGLGLAQQMNSEKEEELNACRHRIQELEARLEDRQKEIFKLNAKLATAESMTHDVLRDLLGVKLDITNVNSKINYQQVQKLVENTKMQKEESQEKEQEILKLKNQLKGLIEERENWLEEINRRQAEMMAARVTAEKLRRRDQFLTTENDMLKNDNGNQKRRIVELEEEIKKLSGQQNLQQRIHHHAKIKEENNFLRAQHDELLGKLRRTEAHLERLKEELAPYRTAQGRSPCLNIDEEQKLRKQLQDIQEEKLQLAQKLVQLCSNIFEAAGVVRPPKEIEPAIAVQTLNQLKERLESTEKELIDTKLKTKIANEKIRLNELRQLSNSPLSSVKDASHSFSTMQSSSSPLSSSIRKMMR